MDVDGPGAPVVVVAPDLLEQLGPREDPPGVLGQVLEEFELLVGQIEDPAPQPHAVGRLVDDQLPGRDRRVLGLDLLAPPDGQPEAGLHLGGSGRVEEGVVDAPVRRQGRQTALGDDDEQWGRQSGRVEHAAQGLGLGEFAAGVDEDEVRLRSIHQRAGLGREDANMVTQQAQRGEHLSAGRQGVRQQQDVCHIVENRW